jgi:hypothetical protein
VFDTADPEAAERTIRAGTRYPVHGRAMAVFRIPRNHTRRAEDHDAFADADAVGLTVDSVAVER